MDQQFHDSLWAWICLLSAVPLFVFALIGTLRGHRRADCRWLGFGIALVGGIFFFLSSAAVGSSNMTISTLINFATNVPVVVTIAHVCCIQAWRYPGSRDRRRIRQTSLRAYPILFGILLAFTALELTVSYPILDDYAPAPLLAGALQGPVLASWFGFSLLAAYVFYEAFRHISIDLPGLGPRIQNISAAVLMTSFAVEAALRLGILAVRIFGSSSQREFSVSYLLTIIDVLMILELSSVVLALGAYFARDEVSKVSSKLLNFFDRSQRIEATLNNAPVNLWPYSGPYEYLKHALTEDDLKLPRIDVEKASDAYRIAVLIHRNGIYHESGRCVTSAEDFVDWLDLYEQDLHDPDISSRASVQPGSQTYSLYELYLSIQPILDSSDGSSLNWMFNDHWLQMVFIALADAGVVPACPYRTVTVLPKLRKAYELGKSRVWYEALPS